MKRNGSYEDWEENDSKRIKSDDFFSEIPMTQVQYKIGDTVSIPKENLFVQLNSHLNPDGPGIYYMYPQIIQSNWKNGSLNGEMIVANQKERRIVGIYGIVNNVVTHIVDLSSVHTDIIDLSSRGKRWEGSVLDDFPCGWGSLFNMYNELEYTGFRYIGSNVCFGSVYSQQDVLEYRGTLHDNVRYGVGSSYQNDSDLLYQGVWIGGQPFGASGVYRDNQEMQALSTATKHVEFPSETALLLSELNLEWLSELETLSVGRNAFWNVEFIHSDFSLKTLSFLRHITINSNSFRAYRTFSISKLPLLSSLFVGDCCFADCEELLLSELPKVNQIRIGRESFSKVHRIQLHFLPCLEHLSFEDYSVQGSEGVPCSLSFIALPRLALFSCGYSCFQRFSSALFYYICNVYSPRITFATKPFTSVASIKCESGIFVPSLL